MRKNTLRLVVALTAFFIGVAAVSVLFFKRQIVFAPTAESNVAADSNLTSSVDEEYAVYSAILEDPRYKNELIIVQDYTERDYFGDAPNLSIPGMTKDTAADYQSKNEEEHNLENKFTVAGQVALLSETKREADFYKNHPVTHGTVVFSRIGFNQERWQALVYVGTRCAALCGDGTFILLEKQNGKWFVRQKQQCWVSLNRSMRGRRFDWTGFTF